MPDLHEMLHDALPEFASFTTAEVNHRAHVLRQRRQQLLSATSVGLLVLAVAWTVVTVRPDAGVILGPLGVDPATTTGPSEMTSTPRPTASSVEPIPSVPPGAETPAEVAARLDRARWHVAAIGSTRQSTLIGNVVTDQAEVDDLWRAAAADGPGPVLPPGRGALFVPIGGSCDAAAQVAGVYGLLRPDGSEVFAAIQFDAACADLEQDGTVQGPPRTLYVITLPLDVVEQLAAVIRVTADVQELPWEVLAVGPIPDRSGLGGLRVTGQDELDGVWHMFGMQGPAPALPAGHGALMVAVPGTCDDAAQLRAVTAAGLPRYGTFPTPVALALFDPECAEPLRIDPSDPQPRTLYVIALPVAAAETLDGPSAYLDCTGQDQSTGACAQESGDVIPADDPQPIRRSLTRPRRPLVDSRPQPPISGTMN